MRYVILGAGAVGGVIGGRLAGAGRPVVLVARGENLLAIRSQGLRLHTPTEVETHRISAVDHPGELDLRPDDVVVVAVKSQDTARALGDLAMVAPPGIAVVCAQNGVDNERVTTRSFANVYAQCVVLPAVHLTAGVVVQSAAPMPGILDLGRYPSGADERAGVIAADLQAAGFRCSVDAQVMRKKYRKLILNLANAIDALCGPAAGGSDLGRWARQEGEACLAAAGIDVQSAEEEQAWRGDLSIRPMPGVERGSSTWQSLARGTGTTEVDWLNGEIVLLGRLHGIPTPVNELLQRETNAAARDNRPPRSMAAEDLVARLARPSRHGQ